MRIAQKTPRSKGLSQRKFIETYYNFTKTRLGRMIHGKGLKRGLFCNQKKRKVEKTAAVLYNIRKLYHARFTG